MIVKNNHKHVDSSGTCYLPYLSGTAYLQIWLVSLKRFAGWRPDTSSLAALASEMKAVFATDPPVRAKPGIKHSNTMPILATNTVHASPPSSGGFPSGSPVNFPGPPSYEQHHATNSVSIHPGAIWSVRCNNKTCQNKARDLLRSKVSKRYEEIYKIVELETEKVFTLSVRQFNYW